MRNIVRIEVPNVPYADVRLEYDPERDEVIIWTDNLPNEMNVTIVDGRGIDHRIWTKPDQQDN